MKAVKLQNAEDRGRREGRRPQRWSSKDLFRRFERPVYNRQPGSALLRDFEVSGRVCVCGGPGAYKPWLAGETFTPPAEHAVAERGGRRHCLRLSSNRLYRYLSSVSAYAWICVVKSAPWYDVCTAHVFVNRTEANWLDSSCSGGKV